MCQVIFVCYVLVYQPHCTSCQQHSPSLLFVGSMIFRLEFICIEIQLRVPWMINGQFGDVQFVGWQWVHVNLQKSCDVYSMTVRWVQLFNYFVIRCLSFILLIFLFLFQVSSETESAYANFWEIQNRIKDAQSESPYAYIDGQDHQLTNEAHTVKYSIIYIFIFMLMFLSVTIVVVVCGCFLSNIWEFAYASL